MGIDVFQVVSSVLVLLFSLSVHESAHAWTADRLGDTTARDLGRISLNPLVHADLFGTIIFPLIGFNMGIIFGWAKPVPVNTARLGNPKRDYMLIAAAGPAGNLLIATGLLILLAGLKASSSSIGLLVNQVARGGPIGDSLLGPLISMAYFGVMINVLLLMFNMIPVAPLDGAAVLFGLLPESLAGRYQQLQKHGVLILIGLMLLGVPWYLFSPILGAVRSFLIY